MNPFIISECGINANGNLRIAKDQIRESLNAGADAVKFQVYNTRRLFKPDSPYFKDSLRGRFSRLGLFDLYRYALCWGIEWFASPFHLDSVDFLEDFCKVKRYKIASRSVVDLELVKKIGETKKPVIMSTGMSIHEQLEKAIKVLNHDKITLLYCVSKYPSKPEDYDLSQIPILKNLFGFPVGLSSHCPDIKFLEKVVKDMDLPMLEVHTTTNRKLLGCDQSSSLEYPEFKELVNKLKPNPIFV